jgi:hypothetical protein
VVFETRSEAKAFLTLRHIQSCLIAEDYIVCILGTSILSHIAYIVRDMTNNMLQSEEY